MQTSGHAERTPRCLRPTRWCFAGLVIHRDGERSQEAQQQQHGGSRSILVGLDPEFDSGCSDECKQLVARIARLEVVVRSAGASMDLQPTETAKEAEKPNNSSMAALGQYWADWTQNLTQTADTSANSRSQGAHAWRLSFDALVLRWNRGSPR